jgi:uncharacterized protein (TIGR00299 family) protein
VIGWLDCSAGASGDMFLGALVDAGVPLPVLQAAIDRLDVGPIRLVAAQTTRHGIGATRVQVTGAETPEVTRTWADVRVLLDGLAGRVRADALEVFGRLARAEASVHRVEPDDVHFHEVGALDALADVAGTCAGIEWLRTERGLDRLVAGPVSLGSGQAHGRHGVVPVPGPAVLAVLGEARLPVGAGPAPYEMCTPTGAALLAALTTAPGPLPEMVVTGTGHGAGGRDVPEVPNLLRLVLGDTPGGENTAVVLETNVDDLDPRLWPPVLEALLGAGASDAWLSPVAMKKGRPAHTLHVLCPEDRVAVLRRAVFTETTSIGLREYRVGKRALDRVVSTVDVDGQAVRVKTAYLAGVVVNASVEYEDVITAAAALGLPPKVVLARATAQISEKNVSDPHT